MRSFGETPLPINAFIITGQCFDSPSNLLWITGLGCRHKALRQTAIVVSDGHQCFLHRRRERRPRVCANGALRTRRELCINAALKIALRVFGSDPHTGRNAHDRTIWTSNRVAAEPDPVCVYVIVWLSAKALEPSNKPGCAGHPSRSSSAEVATRQARSGSLAFVFIKAEHTRALSLAQRCACLELTDVKPSLLLPQG
jgi:hypothetical protein